MDKIETLCYRQDVPARHRIKEYFKNSYYHIYNRGVEKRLIFLDKQDYAVFLSYLKEYLLPKDEKELMKQLGNPTASCKERDKILKLLRLNNFADEITLLAYCLMPNHFHLLVKQKSSQAIDKFMNSLGTRYTMYFNRKYKRVGNLCQGIYKAVLVTDESQFLYLTKYIHRQTLASQGQAWEPIQPSSYRNYLGRTETRWVHPEEILAFFTQNNPKQHYQKFVEENDEIEPVETMAIDIDT